MSMCKSIEVKWSEFAAMVVESDYYKRQQLKEQGISNKYRSGSQWICWTKEYAEEFLPNCPGKLQYGVNIVG